MSQMLWCDGEVECRCCVSCDAAVVIFYILYNRGLGAEVSGGCTLIFFLCKLSVQQVRGGCAM